MAFGDNITNTTPTGSPCGSPFGTPVRKMPPTPQRPKRLSFGGASPPKKGRREHVRSEKPKSPQSNCKGFLGDGSFGTVTWEEDVNGVWFAEKKFKKYRSGKDAELENSLLGSPGCIPGVTATREGEDVLILPLCGKIDFSKMSDDDKASMLESINSCPLFVLNDVKPDNVLCLEKGTPIPECVDGKVSFDKTAPKGEIVVADLTPRRDPEDGDGQWSPLLSVEEMEDALNEMRKYKSDMMLEYIRLCEDGLPEGKIEMGMEKFKRELEHTMWPSKF